VLLRPVWHGEVRCCLFGYLSRTQVRRGLVGSRAALLGEVDDGLSGYLTQAWAMYGAANHREEREVDDGSYT
jgi:hypothetical protein